MFKISEKSKDKLALGLLALISILFLSYIMYKIYEMLGVLLMMAGLSSFLS